MFFIGQKVMCIDASPVISNQGLAICVGLVKNQTYTVEGIIKHRCNDKISLDVGITVPNGVKAVCPKCKETNSSGETMWFKHARFVPLEEYHYKGIVKEELLTTN